MKKEYVTFVSSLDNLGSGQEIKLFIKDLTQGPQKYETRYVKAQVFQPSEGPSDTDNLWVRYPTGFLYPQSFSIRIITEIDEFS